MTRKILPVRPGVVFQPALLAGFDVIARLARGTLGPLARTVAIEANARTSTPEIQDDAGILARRVVQIGDPVADAGAMLLRHALWRMREAHGDGAATAAVIAHALARGAARATAAGAHPALFSEALQKHSAHALDLLRGQSVRIGGGAAGQAALRAVARSMCPDAELCDALTQAVDIIGADGGISIIPNDARTVATEFVEGSMWDAGWLEAALSSEPGKRTARLENAAVLVIDGDLDEAEAFVGGLRRMADAGHARIMIAVDKISEGVKSVLAQIRNSNTAQVIAVRTPFLDYERLLTLQDLCVLTGATLINPSGGRADHAFARLDPAHAGSARRVWANERQFGIIAGRRDGRALRDAIGVLRRQIADERDTAKVDAMRLRLGRLYGGMALIRVGAVSAQAGEARRDMAKRTARALQEALASGTVAGGGAALARLAAQVADGKRSAAAAADSLETRWARDVLADALRQPLIAIVENAGHDASVPLSALARADAGQVFDVRRGVLDNMHNAGVVDPVETLCSAIRIAVSTAVMAAGTDALVLRKTPPTGVHP